MSFRPVPHGRARTVVRLPAGAVGRGYAREACAAAVGLTFERFPDDARLIAVTQEPNDRSVRLLEALGMTRVDAFAEFGARQVRYAVDRPGRRGAIASMARRRLGKARTADAGCERPGGGPENEGPFRYLLHCGVLPGVKRHAALDALNEFP
ncbi:GNAT family N-acetyltransferase [Micromonospora sp. NPDC002296]|uniref:GNAT family N-acetyltransferase n=1 Tax=Micromonospora sp. NPDC002296 TaxID=3154271 RepID=UPI003322B68D